MACRLVTLKVESVEKAVRPRGGDCNAPVPALGVVNAFEVGDVGLLTASSLSDGDNGSRFESWCFDIDFRRIS
jgi:hypothetical protein